MIKYDYCQVVYLFRINDEYKSNTHFTTLFINKPAFDRHVFMNKNFEIGFSNITTKPKTTYGH